MSAPTCQIATCTQSCTFNDDWQRGPSRSGKRSRSFSRSVSKPQIIYAAGAAHSLLSPSTAALACASSTNCVKSAPSMWKPRGW